MVEINDSEVRQIVEHHFAHKHGLEAIVGTYRSISTCILSRLCEPEEGMAFRQALADLVNARTLLAFFRLLKGVGHREKKHAEKLIEMYCHWHAALRYVSANYDELPAAPSIRARYSEQRISLCTQEVRQLIDRMSSEYATQKYVTTSPEQFETLDTHAEQAFQAVLGGGRYNQFVFQFNRADDIVQPYQPMARLNPDSTAH